MDELPWLGTKRSDFIKALGWFWNSWAINHNIVLVICGSAASWMIDKVFTHHTKTKKHLFTSLITTFGVVENNHRLHAIDQVVTLEDLFE